MSEITEIHSDENNLHLLELAMLGDVNQIRHFVQTTDVDVNFQHPLNQWTALHWAAKRGHEKVVEVLLQLGADTKLTNANGQSPMEVTQSTLVRHILIDFADSENTPAIIHDRGSSESEKSTSKSNPAVEYSSSAPQTAGPSATTSGFVPHYIRYPPFPYTNTASTNNLPTANSIGMERASTSMSMSSHISPLTTQPASTACSQPSLVLNASGLATPSCERQSSQRQQLRLCIALPTIYKSAHEGEKKLYRNVYLPTNAERLTLKMFHSHIAAAIQMTPEQLVSNRYVIVNESDATLIECDADMRRFVDGTRIGVFERR